MPSLGVVRACSSQAQAGSEFVEVPGWGCYGLDMTCSPKKGLRCLAGGAIKR
jgi:hypothetical protein